MARAIWSGAISFGLVSIPVKLVNAVSRKTVRFNQIDRRTGSRIRMRTVSALDGEEVPQGELVKGYELPSGEYVTVTDAELGALAPEASRTIEILAFVDQSEIDPVFYDSAYLAVPDEATAKPYRLLLDAMTRADKVGVARFVMRTKEYLAAVRPSGGTLVLSTMVFADELVDPASVGGFDVLEGVEVAEREVAMAEQLIESLTEPFEPEKYHDRQREKVLELIERKASGEETLAAPAAATSDQVVDLMAALEASVRDAKEARARHPAVAGVERQKKTATAAEAGDEAEAKPRRRRKTA